MYPVRECNRWKVFSRSKDHILFLNFNSSCFFSMDFVFVSLSLKDILFYPQLQLGSGLFCAQVSQSSCLDSIISISLASSIFSSAVCSVSASPSRVRWLITFLVEWLLSGHGDALPFTVREISPRESIFFLQVIFLLICWIKYNYNK